MRVRGSEVQMGSTVERAIAAIVVAIAVLYAVSSLLGAIRPVVQSADRAMQTVESAK